jgi:hypothetical protein
MLNVHEFAWSQMFLCADQRKNDGTCRKYVPPVHRVAATDMMIAVYIACYFLVFWYLIVASMRMGQN